MLLWCGCGAAADVDVADCAAIWMTAAGDVAGGCAACKGVALERTAAGDAVAGCDAAVDVGGESVFGDALAGDVGGGGADADVAEW